MEELLRSLLEGVSGGLAYGSVFGVLVACGLGVPLPEDIALVLGGFLVHQGAAHLPAMMVVGLAGILVGDSIIFLAGRRFGSRVGRTPGGLLGRVVTAEKRARVESLFSRHGEKIVMLARFMPGVRAVTFFTAGSVGMSYRRFIGFDGAAALVSAPVFVYLGYRFGGEVEWLIAKLRDGQVWVSAGVAALVVVYLGVRWARRRRRSAPPVALAQVPVRSDAELKERG
ncbi:MAG: DedA family protein [Myxococcota bacterium]